GACLPQVHDCGSIPIGPMSLADARCRRRREAAHVQQVFDRDRDPVERSPILAGRQLTVGFPGLTPRLFCSHEDERVEARVVSIDPAQTFVDRFGRADLACAQLSAELFNRQPLSTTDCWLWTLGPSKLGPYDGLGPSKLGPYGLGLWILG